MRYLEITVAIKYKKSAQKALIKKSVYFLELFQTGKKETTFYTGIFI